MNSPFIHHQGVVTFEIADDGRPDPHVVLKLVEDPDDLTSRLRLDPGRVHTLAIVRVNGSGELWAVLPNDPIHGIKVKHLDNLDRDGKVVVEGNIWKGLTR